MSIAEILFQHYYEQYDFRKVHGSFRK